MATWCRDQMANRYTQAVYINPGLDNEEAKRNEVVTHGDEEIYVCDLPLESELAATDAYATLGADSIWDGWVIAGGTSEDDPMSSLEHHRCRHEPPARPCEVVSRRSK